MCYWQFVSSPLEYLFKNHNPYEYKHKSGYWVKTYVHGLFTCVLIKLRGLASSSKNTVEFDQQSKVAVESQTSGVIMSSGPDLTQTVSLW